jgi:hypothetical protein
MSNLTEYEKYMLTEKNIINFLPQKEEQKLKKEIKTKTKTKINKIKNTISNQVDQLFWCFYIILNGEHEYELNNSFKTEKDFKIQSIEELRKIKPQLKALKLKLNEIENELLNAKKISVKSLIALCLLYKKNLMYVWNRKYYEYVNNSEEPINIIIWDKQENNFSHCIDDEKETYYRENYWCIQNMDKPLKSMTGYTREELAVIVNKLDIENTKKDTKKSLYEKILEKL